MAEPAFEPKVWNDYTLEASPLSNSDTLMAGKAADGDGYRLPLSYFMGAMKADLYDPEAKQANVYDRANHTGTQAISTIVNLQAALDAKEAKSAKGAANGYASLDASGKIPSNQLPAIAITDTFPVASQAAMLGLTAQVGDIAIRSDIRKSFVLRVEPASALGNWSELLTPTDVVTSVNGQTGPVNLGKADVGLASVDDTPDSQKPVSDPQQLALDGKVSKTGAETLEDKTLTTPVVNGYTEGVISSSGTEFAPNLAAGALFAYASTGNVTITLPAALIGKSFTVSLNYGGAHDITWAGAARRWPKGEVPTPTSEAGKIDVFTFLCVVEDVWLAFPSGDNF